MADEQDRWIDAHLTKSKDLGAVHTVVFQHIPWFLKTPDEDKKYFNIEVQQREKMLKKFYAGGVRKIFCGHYHRNAGGWYKDLELVVTSAVGCRFGDDPHGMRLVRVKEDKIEHKYHSLDDFPKNV